MIINLQKKSATSVALIFVLALGSIHLAQAQPDDSQRPASAESLQKLTRVLRQIHEEDWRKSLADDGVKETATQDAVVALLGKQQDLLYPLQQQARLLAQAVASKKVPDVQIAAMLDELRAALRAERQRRAVALADLKAKINYDQEPRVETPLIFLGVVGDEASFLDTVPEALRRLQASSIGDAMQTLGITDSQVKVPVVAFVSRQEQLSKPFLDWAQQCHEILQTKGEQLTEKSRLSFLTTFRGNGRKLQISNQNALLKLDDAIGYTKNPRLEASLFLMGILGNESYVLNNPSDRGISQFHRYRDVITGARNP